MQEHNQSDNTQTATQLEDDLQYVRKHLGDAGLSQELNACCERISSRLLLAAYLKLKQRTRPCQRIEPVDAAQIAMTAILSGGLNKVRAGDALSPYVYGILRCTCFKSASFSERFVSVEEQHSADDRMNPVVQLEIEDRRQSVRMALGKLRPDERALLFERYCDERSLDELASDKGIHKANLKSQIHRASARMRGELGNDFDVDQLGRKRTNLRKKRFR